MADKPTQKNREIAIHTPLGEDVLLLRSFSGTEQLGRPFRYQLELASEDYDIEYQDIVGANVTIRLNLPKGKIRYFNGYISSFTQEPGTTRLASYRATVVPWLWFLTRTADCRIFQEKTIPDIIELVFTDLGFSDYDASDLKGDYRLWPYCVQYRETYFNFVSRLMEQEGIYYFFKHENGKHSLMLIDSVGEHEPYSNYDQIKYHPATAPRSGEEYISNWVVQTRVQPGSYALNDFDFKKPNTEMLVRAIANRQEASVEFEIYDYPGEYDVFSDGELYARKRIEELQAQYEVVTATSDARGIHPGCTFTLSKHPREDQNRKYLITSANYNMNTADFYSGGERGGECAYSCSFTAIDATQPFRAPRITPKPSIPGPQTAMVVGPAGEEICTDEYGRVKVQFHWDRRGNADENSSCWIRVAQVWAGKKWGAMYIPRIGQEVIIEFLEGDPDQPIITGRVYNAQAMPPYDLPSEKTKSTLKSNSSMGGGGFNEIRFEDKKGDEQIFIHAEKDQDVRIKNDCTEWIGNERHLMVTTDQIEQVNGDKHLTVAGDQNEKIDGTISIEAGADIQEKAGSNYGFEAGSDIHIKGGMNVVIEAGMQLSLKAGSNFIDIGPTGVAISGTPTVMINSGGAAGSGSGCKPDAPKEPKEADTAEPGQTLAPPKPPKPPTPVKFSPQSTVMKEAAKDGTPFCEECEAAKKAGSG